LAVPDTSVSFFIVRRSSLHPTAARDAKGSEIQSLPHGVQRVLAVGHQDEYWRG